MTIKKLVIIVGVFIFLNCGGGKSDEKNNTDDKTDNVPIPSEPLPEGLEWENIKWDLQTYRETPFGKMVTDEAVFETLSGIQRHKSEFPEGIDMDKIVAMTDRNTELFLSCLHLQSVDPPKVIPAYIADPSPVGGIKGAQELFLNQDFPCEFYPDTGCGGAASYPHAAVSFRSGLKVGLKIQCHEEAHLLGYSHKDMEENTDLKNCLEICPNFESVAAGLIVAPVILPDNVY